MLNSPTVRLILATLLLAVGLPLRIAAQTSSTIAVSQLTLINTTTQKSLRALTSGSTINLAVDGTALNVRADVSGTVGSVAFLLDGRLVQTENVAPFAMEGDTNGVYIKWTPPLGIHTIRAVPYTSKDRTGTAGLPMEVKFTVTNVAPTSTPPTSTNRCSRRPLR